MNRQTTRFAMLLAAFGLVLGAAAGKQPTTLDRIVVRDKDKKDGSTKTLNGTFKLGPGGFQVTAADGKITLVSPADVIKVIPGELPGVDRAKLDPYLALEDKRTHKDIEAAHQGYVDLLQKATGAPPATREFLLFKRALTGTHLLDDAEDEDWGKQAEPIAKEWEDFLAEYKTGWEVWPAAQAAGRLYVEMNKYGDAERLWKRMAAKDVELPADLKAEAALRMIDAQISSGAYASASTAAEAESKDPALASQSAKDKLAIYAIAAKAGDSANNPTALSGAIKEIDAKIAASKDPTVRAVGFSMIGELYLAAKRYREAMWAYMWVETVYNSDKDEVLKAVVRLGQIFKAQADDDHEKQYREKLRRLRAQL